MFDRNVPVSIATPLARHQLVGRGLRIRRLAAVVLGHDDELLAVDAAGCVDLFDRKLPALAIGLGECRQQRVAVDLADLDVFRQGRMSHAACQQRERRADKIVLCSHPNLHFSEKINAVRLRP
ncbi:hypothetical protein ACVWWO_008892 [Bradyrhizobium sp. F1.13.1]